MDNNSINRIWKEAKNSPAEKVKISREEIESFRLKRSNQILSEARKGIWIAIVLKSIILLADLVLIALFYRAGLPGSLLFMILALSALLVFEMLFLRKVKRIEDFSDAISERLNRLKIFFKVDFPLFHLLSTLSNPLMVATGIFYYKQLKYSEVIFRDMEDIFVLTVILVLSYLLGLAVGWMASGRLRGEVEELQNEEIVDKEHLSMIIARDKKLRRRRILMFSMVFILGILMLALIIVFNYKMN